MRHIKTSALFWLIGAFAAASFAMAAEQTLGDRIELLDWSDPERAARFIDEVPQSSDSALRSRAAQQSEVQMLEVRGMVYADVHRDADVDATVARLEALARQGVAAATPALHYVRAYSLYQRDRYSAATAELSHIPIDAIEQGNERYRIWLLSGNALRVSGEIETALPLLERALDLANEMHDDLRGLHAMLWLTRIYIDTGNFERANEQLDAARSLAEELGDESALADVESSISDIADRRGDHVAERRASLASLDHAERSGSNKWIARALVNLSDSYLKTRDFAASLKASKQVLPLLQKLREGGSEPIALFNEGLAYIGLGNFKQGRKLADDAIAGALADNALPTAREFLREYANALEQAGFLMMAIQVYHRYDEVSGETMTATRQRAFLELSAKFDNERKARELELLRRDNALKVSEMSGQRLRQQFIIAAAAFVCCICAALIWAFARVRKANDRLRFNSERDALTGLHNRRYFNEHVLTVDGSRPVGGCVLLADLDHFKRINDTLGHPAGDAVLATVSHRLSAALRETDKLVRWGGEEFLAVLDPITTEQADVTVERLLQAVRRDPVLWNGQPIYCTISIGYACFPMAGSKTDISLDSAIRLVDKALYEAKRRGRDRACLINELSAQSERDLTTLSAEFESAAADRRIHLVDMGAAA